MIIHQSECMGKTLYYVITSCGNYLYKERKKSSTDWQKKLIKLLHEAKYTNDEIVEIVKCYSTKNWFMCENYYKKPEHIVQRVNELGGEWVIDLELSR